MSELYYSASQIDDSQTTFDRSLTHSDSPYLQFVLPWSIFPILSKVMPSSSSRFSWVQRVGCMVVPLASIMLVYHLSQPFQQSTADRMGSAGSTVELSGSTWWDPNTQCILGWFSYQPNKKKNGQGCVESVVIFFKVVFVKIVGKMLV